MDNIQNNTTFNGHDSPGFWAWHPIGRGIGTGFACTLFTAATSFETGFVYGGISGLANVALRPIFKKINKGTTSPEVKAVNYLFSLTLPWMASAKIMHHFYRSTGNALFHLNPTVAIGTGIAAAYFNRANRDLRQNINNRIQ
ncbi:MAG: hypothetical protein H7A37_03415 [Chlamydiales bacterium]|nr:hypothetical protein [Chlamydiia bacterium]MCP5507336.1 hypothetical protein [Chlamydiales bacterium]